MPGSFPPAPRSGSGAHRGPRLGWRNAVRPPTPVSDAECLDWHLRDLSGRVLLLPGDEPAVPHRECFEQPALHIVGPALPELVLDPKRHHRLADERVAEVLLDVGKPGD